MTWRERNRQMQQIVRSMPRRSRFLLASAIFMTFASLGLTGDTLSLLPTFWQRAAAGAAFSGVVGLGYAVVGLGYRWVLPFVIALNLFGPAMFSRTAPPRTGPHALDAAEVLAVERRLGTLSAVRIGFALVGYSCFVAVLRLESRRSFGAYTEIRLAREIHAGLVPVVAGQNAVLEWHGVSRPSGDVGGDLVDVVASDASFSSCIADVSGHGVGAGVLMGMFKTALRSALRVSPDPAAVTSQINDVINPLKQPNMFVTAAVLSARDGGTLDYVLAGHPSLIHVSAGTGDAQWVGESQLAVGFIDEVHYTAASVTLAPGDTLAVPTDGLIEIFDRAKQELGAAGLLRVVQSAARLPTLSQVSDDIFNACARHGLQQDDQSLLLIRRRV